MFRDKWAGFKQILPQPSQELVVVLTVNRHNLVGASDHYQVGDLNIIMITVMSYSS